MQGYKKILIVEDELIAAESLKAFLRENGYEVIGITDSGAEAFELAKKLQPEIIFMDIMLKDGLSGSEAALKISRISSAKIVFLTAYAEDEMLDYATRSKAAAYLVKPYNKRQILATLRLLVHGEENTPQVDTVKLIDGYRFDMSDEQLYFRDTQVKLGPRARRLLALLCRTPGASVSNSQISMHIWGEEVDNTILRALIYRTRVIVGDELIQNVSGGYRVAVQHGR